MLIVITYHTPVIASMQCMVDVGKVVTSYATLRVNPNFTSMLTLPTLFCDVERIVDDFSISHDIFLSWLVPRHSRSYQFRDDRQHGS